MLNLVIPSIVCLRPTEPVTTYIYVVPPRGRVIVTVTHLFSHFLNGHQAEQKEGQILILESGKKYHPKSEGPPRHQSSEKVMKVYTI